MPFLALVSMPSMMSSLAPGRPGGAPCGSHAGGVRMGARGKAKPGGLEFSQGCSVPGEKFLRPLRPQAVPGEPARVQGEPLEVGKVQGSVVPHLT